MDKRKVFTFVNPGPFFKKYLPNIKNYNRKINGINGRGNPLDFSEHEKDHIKKAIETMAKDLIK